MESVSGDSNVLTNVTASGNNRTGVSFESSDDNVLSGVTTTRNQQYGIQFDGETHNNTLTNTIANRNRRGIHLFTGHDYTLTNTTANGNKRFGIDLSYSDNSTFEDTVTDDNGGPGVILTDTSNGNTLVDTIADDNGGDGLSIGYSHRVTVTNVTTNSNRGTGIALESDFTSVSNAVANDNHRNGIALHYSKNSTVRDSTTLGNGRDGIGLDNVQNTSLANSITKHNGRYGISLGDGGENTLRENTIDANEGAGIELYGKLSESFVYDNLFNNTQNVLFYRTFDNRSNAWNTSKRTGPNVIGGPTLGGNYYARPNGTGFSQTCTDTTGDGTCDRPNDFGVDNNNTDYLSLAHPGSFPDITVSPHNLSFGDVHVGETATANVTITNTGTNTLRVTRAAISGPNASSFSIAGDGVPIRPGESQRVAVTFAPTSQGTKRATLSIASNDPDQPTVSVALRGTATPEDQRSVFPHPLRIALHPTVSFTIGPPRDLNGDRLYEDVDGDHRFGVKDIVALEIVVSANRHGYLHLNERQVAALDFNQDGTLGQKDVGVLAYGRFISRR